MPSVDGVDLELEVLRGATVAALVKLTSLLAARRRGDFELHADGQFLRLALAHARYRRECDVPFVVPARKCPRRRTRL